MISIPKAPFLSAVSQVVPNGTRPLVPLCVASAEKLVLPPPVKAKSNRALAGRVPKTALSITSSVTGSQQVRFAHTDIRFPDYDTYRRSGTKDSAKTGDEAAVSGRAFTYLLAGGGAIATVYGGKTMVNAFIDSMSASADVLALAKVELSLADIPEGKNAALKWRGKPLFVRHRTAEEIETEQAVNLAELRDPQHDSDRTQKPEWLVLVGVCTHLGCVPVANAGEYGGYFCPCHGSHYDTSGRIRKGPAPLNLEVPVHSFPDEETLVVG